MTHRRAPIRTFVMKARLGAMTAAFAVLACALFASTSASLSQAAPKTIPLLRMGTTFLPPTLNPGNFVQNNAVYYGTETLLTIKPDGTIGPNLAVSWKRLTDFNWRFTLRKGVKFWNGHEMTSADVANAINYQRYPGLLSSGGWVTVRTVRPVSRYEVEFVLKRRDAALPATLSYRGSIFEKAYFDQHSSSYGKPGNPVEVMGTGPWIPKSFTPNVGEELEANPNYWGGKPHVQRISIRYFSNETTEALAFRANEIDVVFPGGPQAWETAAGSKLIVDPVGSELFFLVMDVKKPPFSDVHVRRAIAHAINRPDIVKAFGPSFASPVTTFLTPNQLRTLTSKAQVDALLKTVPQYPFSLAKARAQLAESSVPNGFTSGTYTYNGFSLPILTQVVQQQMKQIGITWNIQQVGSVAQWQPFRDTMEAFVTRGPLQTPDVATLASGIFGSWNIGNGRGNWSDYAPPKVDELMKSGIGTYNPAKRFVIYGQLLKQISADVPVLPLFLSHRTVALSSGFTFKYPSMIHLYVGVQWPSYIEAK